MFRNIIPVSLGLMLVLLSCKDEKETITTYQGYEYFPLSTGMERVYDVDSLVYREVKADPDTFTYQVREVFADTLTDLSGQPAWKVEKYVRFNDTLPWTLDHVFTMNRTGNTAEVFDQNTRLVKLVFPMREKTTFNTNLYNTDPPTESHITDLNRPFDIGTFHFDSSLLVTIRNDSDFLNRELDMERYTPGIGLVYKQFVTTEKIVIGSDVKYNGVKYFYRLRSFSK